MSERQVSECGLYLSQIGMNKRQVFLIYKWLFVRIIEPPADDFAPFMKGLVGGSRLRPKKREQARKVRRPGMTPRQCEEFRQYAETIHISDYKSLLIYRWLDEHVFLGAAAAPTGDPAAAPSGDFENFMARLMGNKES